MVKMKSAAMAPAICSVLFFNCLVDLELQNNHLVVTDNGSSSSDKEMNQ